MCTQSRGFRPRLRESRLEDAKKYADEIAAQAQAAQAEAAEVEEEDRLSHDSLAD